MFPLILDLDVLPLQIDLCPHDAAVTRALEESDEVLGMIVVVVVVEDALEGGDLVSLDLEGGGQRGGGGHPGEKHGDHLILHVITREVE